MLQLYGVRKWLIVAFLRGISLALFGIGLVHVTFGVIKLVLIPFKLWEHILIVIQLLIELLVFFQSATMIQGISQAVYVDPPELIYEKQTKYPPLDVFIPTRRVETNILEKTIVRLRDQNYPQDKLHIFIADDTPEDDLSKQYEEVAVKHNVVYIRDPTNKKFKSGMLNIALKQGNSEFVAFFDYDQVPTPGILEHFIDVLESYPDYVFVQAKKTFRDLYNLSRIWSSLLYVQFFEVVEKTKSKLDTVMFAGSTACFRRKAIDDVGGIPEDTFTEDNSLTLKLMARGEFGLFSDRVGSVGTVPTGFPSQISQLWRWSHGGTHVLRNRGMSIVKSPELSVSQKIDIISTFSITPILVLIYIYSASFIPLILNDVNSPRFEILGISSLIFIPVAPALTYLIMAMIAVGAGKKNEYSSYEYHHILGFLIIAVASNILILSSGILGILGLYGPQSKKGEWNREVNIWSVSVVGFLLGIVIEFFAIDWLISGYSSAIILVLVSVTLLPTLPIVIYYSSEKRY